MKKIVWLTLALGLALLVRAESGAPAGEQKTDTLITSDSSDINLKDRLTIYRGHVRVDDPQIKLTCDLMTVKAPEQGDRIDSIIAEGNVVIDMVDQNSQTNHATGKKLVYTYKVENSVTNALAQLTGEPEVDGPQFWMTGDVITWDRITGNISVSGRHRTVYKHGLMGETNQPPAAVTNPAPAAQPAPATP